MPPESQIRWCWDPDGRGRPEKARHGPPFEGAHVGAVDGAAIQVQRAGRAQLGQEQLVQGRPDAGLGPVPQPPPAGHSGAADQGRRQLVPGDPGLEDEHDAGQRRPVIDRSTTRMPMSAGLRRWQQGLDPLPQSIGHQLLDHPTQLEHDKPKPVEARRSL